MQAMKWAMWAEKRENDHRIEYRADKVFPSASLVKLSVLLHYLSHYIDSLHEKIEVPNAHGQYDGSGVLRLIESDLKLTVRDLLFLMAANSDNLAANILIEQAGMDEINNTLQRIGLHTTRVTHLIKDFDALRDFRANPTTARETAQIMAKIVTFPLGWKILSEQQYRCRIPRYIKAPNVRIANKTGTLDGVVHDAACILTEQKQTIIVMLTKQQQWRSRGLCSSTRKSRL